MAERFRAVPSDAIYHVGGDHAIVRNNTNYTIPYHTGLIDSEKTRKQTSASFHSSPTIIYLVDSFHCPQLVCSQQTVYNDAFPS
jgi:hypothetical protein